jgi:CubicO group peptidase (beta-lactamase class C family)
MKKQFLLTVFLLPFFSLAEAQNQLPKTILPASQNEANSKIESIIRREMQERKIPGLQISVVKQGKIVFLKSYGFANLQDSVPVSNKTIFAINSCTKSFTGVAIMQLVEEGKIKLSDPISQYVHNLPTEWQPVTIKQLLTHISGLPDILRVLNKKTGGVDELETEEKAWEKIKTRPMDFKTGEQFSYNQTNYVLLGKVIDTLRYKSFTEVFKDKQFIVAGMLHTVFADSRDVVPHLAPTYRYQTVIDGEKLATPKLINNYAEFPLSRRTCSGLNSTAEDMANWIIALQSGKFFKNKATLEQLFTPGTYNNGQATQWSPGFGITKIRPKHKAIGMSGGARSAFLIYPDDDLAVVVLSNLGGGSPEDFLEELASCYNPEIAEVDPVTLLRTKLPQLGFDKAIDTINEAKKKNPSFQTNENDLNDWGYRLMNKGQIKDAVEIFKLNVNLYPQSWNVYDSYGEALMKIGKKDEAVKMYQKSVELNPDNNSGKKVLEKILK